MFTPSKKHDDDNNEIDSLENELNLLNDKLSTLAKSLNQNGAVSQSSLQDATVNSISLKDKNVFNKMFPILL